MKKFLMIALAAATPTNALAGAGTEAAEFLKISPDSRSAAMGNTGAADAGNGFAVFHNPALLSADEARFRASGGQTQGLLGSTDGHYAASGRVKEWGLSFGASQWASPSFETTDAMGNATGRSAFKAQTLGLAAGRALTETFHMGIGVKRLSQSLAGSASAAASATAWDAGLFARGKAGRWSAGAALQNAGSAGLGAQKESLPVTARLGAVMSPANGGFTWTAEAVHTRANGLTAAAGLGYTPFQSLSLRAGYDGRAAGAKYAGLTTGFGLRLGDVALDYAFTPFGDLGNAQRISLSWAVGGSHRAPVKRARWEARDWRTK